MAKQKDLFILMGDFNAKVGEDNKGYETIMGQQGLECMNENGELFADFCLSNDLVIAGTIFHTGGSTKPLGYHRMVPQKTKLIMCASLESLEGHYRM